MTTFISLNKIFPCSADSEIIIKTDGLFDMFLGNDMRTHLKVSMMIVEGVKRYIDENVGCRICPIDPNTPCSDAICNKIAHLVRCDKSLDVKQLAYREKYTFTIDISKDFYNRLIEEASKDYYEIYLTKRVERYEQKREKKKLCEYNKLYDNPNKKSH